MWKDKSPGVKILWVWTIGTAAVLVANVATSRMRDMKKVLDAQEQEQQQQAPQSTDSTLMDSMTGSTEIIREDDV